MAATKSSRAQKRRVTFDAGEFGRLLSAAMAREGVTIQHLADAAGVRWQTAQWWAQGKSLPEVVQLPAIAHTLRVSVDYLLAIAQGEPPPFEAWEEFLALVEERGEELTEGELATLKSIPWPADREPTREAYWMALQSVRSTRPRSR